MHFICEIARLPHITNQISLNVLVIGCILHGEPFENWSYIDDHHYYDER